MLDAKDGQTKQRQRLFPIFVSALRAAPFLYFLCISLLYFYGTFSTFLSALLCDPSFQYFSTIFTISMIVFKQCCQ